METDILKMLFNQGPFAMALGVVMWLGVSHRQERKELQTTLEKQTDRCAEDTKALSNKIIEVVQHNTDVLSKLSERINARNLS